MFESAREKISILLVDVRSIHGYMTEHQRAPGQLEAVIADIATTSRSRQITSEFVDETRRTHDSVECCLNSARLEVQAAERALDSLRDQVVVLDTVWS